MARRPGRFILPRIWLGNKKNYLANAIKSFITDAIKNSRTSWREKGTSKERPNRGKKRGK